MMLSCDFTLRRLKPVSTSFFHFIPQCVEDPNKFVGDVKLCRIVVCIGLLVNHPIDDMEEIGAHPFTIYTSPQIFAKN